MKILASVYACSPYDGSERAVGWNWICELDKFHKITVLTSHIYRSDIEDYLKKNPNKLPNTDFIYVKVPEKISSWHIGYRGERLYYILWQYQAYKVAKELIKIKQYDLIHHITYVTCILPTYMHKLNIPFLYGPVSGGENIPSIIKYPISIKNYFKEFIRNISQNIFRITPNFHKTMNNSNLILVTTNETKAIIPKKYHNKVKKFQAIGLNQDMFYPEPIIKKNNKIVKILISGRMIYWKGYELAIWSFIKALKYGCNIELTILGDIEYGNKEQQKHRDYLKSLCGEYLDKKIKFISRIEHNKMKLFYDKFDILLNCSLRDSGCFVVMEGMSRGLPGICVDTGGPKVNTTDDTAVKIKEAPIEDMINEISKAIIKLAESNELRWQMGEKARKYALDNFLLESRTQKMNQFYEEIILQNIGGE